MLFGYKLQNKNVWKGLRSDLHEGASGFQKNFKMNLLHFGKKLSLKFKYFSMIDQLVVKFINKNYEPILIIS